MSDRSIPLRSIHHVEFWVGNAMQAAYFYRQAFGFSQVAYSGLETGHQESSSYVMTQGAARIVLTTPLDPDSVMADHVRRHGDGVKDVAFQVDDAEACYLEALRRGAESALQPQVLEDDHGRVTRASVKTYGETIHSFFSHHDYDGPFLPGYVERRVPGRSLGVERIDHIVGNVELGRMNHWADWYSRVLGFNRYVSFDDKDISTEYTALMSIVMSDDNQIIKFPINEPAAGRKKSQIEEYLEFYRGPGVQHIALETSDILRTVRRLKDNDIAFLGVPDSYYDALPERVGAIEEGIQNLRPLGILADRDDEGYLLQIFTKPVEDRPTVFFEIIERHGSRGFGKGNFKALFEAIEREQALRGTL